MKIKLNKKQKKMTLRIIVSGVLLLLASILPENGIIMWLKYSLYLFSYVIIGYDIIKKAFKGVINRRPFDENFLMAVATLGAVFLAIYEKSGDFGEAVAVMLFYQIGELFQGYAVGKSRKSITALMDIRPDYANLEVDGRIERVSPDEVEVGSVIVVRPGEKIPIDGVIIEGKTAFNTVALTGESIPRDVKEGDEASSGCINMTGVIKIKTLKAFEESTVSKILELVENSSSHKSKSEDFISKFARVYTPAVCGCAVGLAIVPPIANEILLGTGAAWNVWIYRALTFLVISCPCALVISIPLSFFAGLGGASRDGVLIKGSNYIETLSKVGTVAFDKTGTLTKGVFEVYAVHHNEMTDEKLMEYAALAEASSTHPIAKSIIKAYGKEIDLTRVSDINEISGNGVTANIDNERVAVGNSKLMKALGVSYRECHCVGTIVHISINDEYAGHIVISDMEKPNVKEAVKEIKKSGIKKTVMLTGDIKKVADKVAERIGVDEVYSELLPSDKVKIVEKLINDSKGGKKVAFVGDGINDAPVISRADIGIAMGGIGSDAAIEAADVVLMDDDPKKIAKAIKVSRRCIRIVYENIVFALGVKFLCLVLSAMGLADMRAAIFADVGVMILAVLNAIRALKKV